MINAAAFYSLTETEVEQDGKRFLLRSAPRPAASLALRAAGVALPADRASTRRTPDGAQLLKHTLRRSGTCRSMKLTPPRCFPS